jgi:Spondin_N
MTIGQRHWGRDTIGGWIAALALAGCGGGGAPTSPEAPPSAPATATARYTVTFQASWSAASHPVEFPSNAHFSGLIGGTHSNAVSFWSAGGVASDGIRNMAELGAKTPLDGEVRAAIDAGRAGAVLSGGGIGVSPGTVSLDFEISPAFPLVTLVSMVAPSPDWFVGVSSLSLVANGLWIDRLEVDLYPFDAGTDGGLTYQAADQATIPRQPISRIQGRPFAVNGTVAPLGTFTFRRLTN